MASRARRSSWLDAFAVALVVSFPFVFHLGRDQPTWIEGAWQVSAVLVGLVIALVVFLLQAVAGQSLRADSSYRAVLSRTHVVWPLALALVFIGWIGVAGRFADPDAAPPPAWSETWVLGLLVFQLASFGVVFMLLLQLVSPRGVATVIDKSFADGIRRSVRQKLLRKLASAELAQRYEAVGGSFGSFFASGQRLTAGREGWVHDIDLRLPHRLRYYRLTQIVQLTVELGQLADPSEPIARVSGPITSLRTQLLRGGVCVRRRSDPDADPLEVFGEALGIAHRAIRERGTDSVDVALDLLVSCVEQLPLSYELYGFDYTQEAVSDGFLPSDEDRLLRGLRGFCRAAILSGDPDIAHRMPALAHRLASSAIRLGAPFLLHQASEVWLNQAYDARDIPDEDLRQRIMDQVAEAATWSVRSLSSRLEDQWLDASERVAAKPHLERLFRFEVELFKTYLDAGDLESFRRAWRHWSEWGRHWQPEHLVEDLDLELSMASDPSRQRDLRRQLDAATEVLTARDALLEYRQWLIFQLGAWLTWRYGAGEIDEKTWAELAPYLQGTFSSTSTIALALPTLYESDEAIRALRRWEMGKHAFVPGQPASHPADVRLIARRWAVLLLLRATSPKAQPEFPLGVEPIGNEILAEAEALASESQRWEPIAGPDLAQRVNQLKSAIEQAVESGRRATVQRVAREPLDPERVELFVSENRVTFEERAQLRKKLIYTGAFSIEPSDGAFAGGRSSMLLSRGAFVREPTVRSLDWDKGGRQAAIQQDMAVFEELVSVAQAQSRSDDPVAQAVRAIRTLRDWGHVPDVVLGPVSSRLRRMFGANEDFRWAERGFMSQVPELGHLDGVPVLDLGPRDANVLVVADLGKAIQLVERKVPDMDSSLRVSVDAISESRAEELIAARDFPPDADTDEVARQLREETVEARVEPDFRVERRAAAERAAIAVPLLVATASASLDDGPRP
jgi:hypothetical protein